MSFPWDEAEWAEVAHYLIEHATPRDRALAPDVFVQVFDRVYRYRHTEAEPGFEYDWAVIQFAWFKAIPRSFLVMLPFRMTPVLTNSKFAVWARVAPDEVRADPAMVEEFVRRAAALPDTPVRFVPTKDLEPVLPDRNVIERFDALSKDEFAAAMDGFFLHGGYQFPTERDRVYDDEMSGHLTRFAAGAEGMTMLDIGAATGIRLEPLSPEICLIGVDISNVAIAMCRERFPDRPNWRFEVADAHELPVPDASVDLVSFVDTIEHVWRAADVVAECARVLKPGGRLLITAANRDSLHMVMTRKLGYPEWTTNYQHIAEFNSHEVTDMIEAAGLEIIERRGTFLYPYWGVPGVDRVVRHVIDEDPEVVALTRELGELVGAEHAYMGVYTARKP